MCSGGDNWAASDQAQLLADVQLGGCAATGVAWCPVHGLLAVGARLRPGLACVHLMSVHCLEHHVTLEVPLDGPRDALVGVAWSPAGCKRILLAATRAGRVYAWQQPPWRHPQQQVASEQSRPTPPTVHQPFNTLEDWKCQEVAQLLAPTAAPEATAAAAAAEAGGGPAAVGGSSGPAVPEQLVGIQWLQPQPCWTHSSTMMQQEDFRGGSLLNMFAPAAPTRRSGGGSQDGQAASADQGGTGSMVQWVQPGVPAYVAFLSSGRAVVGWARLWVDSKLRWFSTQPLALLSQAAGAGQGGGACPVPGSLLAADAVCCPGGIQVALAAQPDPRTVHVVALGGNPIHAANSNYGAPVSLLVQQLASCSLQGVPHGAAISSIAWQPGSQGQALVAAAGGSSSASDGGSGVGGQLVLLSLRDQQQPSSDSRAAAGVELLHVSSAPLAAVPPRQQLAWLLDGLLCYGAPPESGAQQRQQQFGLYGSQQLQRLPVGFPPLHAARSAHGWRAAATSSRPEPSAEVQALAASPHGVAVAVVLGPSPGLSSSSGGGDGGSGSSLASDSGSSRLLVLNVPPAAAADGSAGEAMAPLLAGRLLWALLQQQHKCDLVPHVMLAMQQQQQQQQQPGGPDGLAPPSASPAEAVAVGVSRLAQVLALVDRKVVGQVTLPQAYLARWDALKLALLATTPGDDARACSIDLRLRRTGLLLKHLGDVLRLEEWKALQAQQAQQQVQQQAQQAGAPMQTIAARGRAISQSLCAALFEFEAACLKTWLTRRVAATQAEAAAASGSGTAAEAAAAAAAAARVPCIRHLLDLGVFADVVNAHAYATQLVPECGTGPELKLIQETFKAAAVTGHRQELGANWEEVLAGVVPGPFQLLQYDRKRCPDCLPSFCMPPEKLAAHLQAVKGWEAVPVLSDADITAEATRLGLLPARTASARGAYYREVRQHARFRRQLPPGVARATPAPVPPALPAAHPASVAAEGPASPAPDEEAEAGSTGRLAAAKRRRWQQLLGSALGEPLAPGLVGAGAVIDLAHFTWVDTAGAALQSVDGAMLAVEGTPAQLLQPQAGSGRVVSTTTLTNAASGWALACPITHELWVRPWGGLVPQEQELAADAGVPAKVAREA